MAAGVSVIAILFVVVFGGLIALAVGLAARARRKNEEKTRQMAALAAAAGWTYWGSSPQLVDSWPCAPFHTGQGRRVENCVEGTHRGVPFLAFEYHYYTETHSTDSEGHSTTQRQNHSFDVAVLRLQANIPDLDLRPEGALNRFVDAFSGNDIDLEWDVFNRSFRLACPDRKFAFDTFTARTMEFLVSRGKVSFCFAGGDALMYRTATGYDPSIWGPGDPSYPVDQSPAPFDLVLTVLRGIPAFVWQERGGVPPSLTGVRW